MKFTISKNAFTRLINNVIRAVATRSTLPILSHIRLQTYDSFCKATATDLEIALSCEEPLASLVSEPGDIAVPAKLLQQIVSNMPAGDITVSCDDKLNVTIKGGKSKYTINALPGDDYPLCPTVEGTAISFDAADLKQALRHTTFAMASDEARQILCGVLLASADANSIALASTDTHRMASDNAPAVVDIDSESSSFALVIPSRAAYEIERITASGTVEMQFNDTQAQIVANGITLTSRLIQGQFPDIKRVIPDKAKMTHTVEFDKANFVESIKRVGLVASTENGKVGIEIAPQGDTATVFARSEFAGYGEDQCAVTHNGTSDFRMFFNYEYLLDFLQSVNAEKVTLYADNPLGAALIVAEGKENDSYKYVVMPMQELV